MASLNSVVLIGNLTREPELKFIPSGSAVCTMNLAINRQYVSNGEKKEEVLFVKVNAWGKVAENCGKYLIKGSQVAVEGRLQMHQWEDKDGQKRSRIDVLATNVQFMSKPKDSGKKEIEESENDKDLMPYDEVPF